MDLKNKGKTWVGTMYNKFEAMCLEVDDLVSKDTVKYVGSQVNHVSKSVKRFCSDMVQDILPPPEASEECNAEAVAGQENDAVRMGIKETRLSFEHDDAEEVTNSNLLKQSPLLSTVDSPDAVSISFSEQDGESSIKEYSEASPENMISSDRYCGDTMVSSAPFIPPVDDAGRIDSEEKGISCNSFSYDIECISNVSSTDNLWEIELPWGHDTNHMESNNLSGSPDMSVDRCHNDNPADTVSLKASISAPLVKSEPLCDSVSSQVGCTYGSSSVKLPELEFSLFSCGNEGTERDLGSSSFSTWTESLSSSISSLANSTQKEESLCGNQNGSSGYIFDTSNSLLPFDSNDSNNSRHHASVLMAGSSQRGNEVCCKPAEINVRMSSSGTDINNSRCPGSVLMAGSSQSGNELCREPAEINVIMSSPGTGNSYFVSPGDPEMETIDLSTEEKRESPVIVDSHFFYAASPRGRNFRYYKKLIKDAVGSRKRLTKEYEQLAICYGDIDAESSQAFMPSSSLPSPTFSPHLETPLTNHARESEWEIL